MRLVEGYTRGLSIVQVCESEDWNTICAEGWDSTDANVVCRQLGFASKGLLHTKTLLFLVLLLNLTVDTP